MSDLSKYLDESEDITLWNIGNAKQKGLLGDITWPEIAEFMNRQFRESETCFYDSSAYRKKYRNFADAYEVIFSREQFTEKQFSENQDTIKELYKAKKQYEDQRRECRKIWTAEARFDNLTEKLIDSIDKICNEKPLEFNDCYSPVGQGEACLCFADWHYGMVTDNIWNVYNTEICRQRVATLVRKTIPYLKLHNIKTLHVLLLGDHAHGSIHNSARVASEEDTCDQLMHVSELIAESVNELSQYVNEVNVYATYGNHMRTVQNKNDSIHSDNMERIIPWYLEQRMKDNPRVNIIKSDYYEFIYLNIMGYNIVATHGDLDKFKNIGVTINTIFNRQYGTSIDFTISADKHHLEEFEQFGIESILVRSLCGVDEYSNINRLYSLHGQTLMIFSKEDGRQCTYNIRV